MEYHIDRFEDFSLLLFKDNKVISLLPANCVEQIVYSHQGLSYGGFIIDLNNRFQDFYEMFLACCNFLVNEGVSKLIIREIPSIYGKSLGEEFQYLASKLNFELKSVDSYYVIDNQIENIPNRNRKRALKIADSKNPVISTGGLDIFWDKILKHNLNIKYNVEPVHTLTEIKGLMNKFPNSIKFYSVAINNDIKAGVLLFITNNVAHFQYSSGINKKETGAIDYLFDYIIKEYANKKFVSFGSSSTDKSLKINPGLAYWKESFGAKLIPQRTYEIKLDSTINSVRIFK